MHISKDKLEQYYCVHVMFFLFKPGFLDVNALSIIIMEEDFRQQNVKIFWCNLDITSSSLVLTTDVLYIVSQENSDEIES